MANVYDNPRFFELYSQMPRSKEGLDAAGEWSTLRKMFPDFKDKRVLDLGCGYGWHCRYAADQGAAHVMGIDCSEKMLAVAKQDTKDGRITYEQKSIEDIDFAPDSFDIVISSLAFHYVASFDDIVKKIKQCLVPGGALVFSVENPIFTASGTGVFHPCGGNDRAHWPVDRYFDESERWPNFLGVAVRKYHKTLTTYINTLLRHGFALNEVVEPLPDQDILESWPDEKRRPMMLIISARLQ